MLLGFKKRFVPNIENGSKCQTVRETPKRMPKVGETLYMYTGLRTKNCALITKEHTLKSTQDIKMIFTWHVKDKCHYPRIWVDGRMLNTKEGNDFMIRDGFTDESDFVSFWKDLRSGKDAQFIGILIHWTAFKY